MPRKNDEEKAESKEGSQPQYVEVEITLSTLNNKLNMVLNEIAEMKKTIVQSKK